MLANNICDIEDDLANKRYTLPIYIGEKWALLLFKSLYYISYGIIVLLLALKVIPLVASLALLTFTPVSKHIGVFYQKRSKQETFVPAVKNFVLVSVAYLLTIIMAVLWGVLGLQDRNLLLKQ